LDIVSRSPDPDTPQAERIIDLWGTFGQVSGMVRRPCHNS